MAASSDKGSPGSLLSSAAPRLARYTKAVQALLDRNGGAVLAGILLVALVARLAVLASLRESLYGDFLLWDERTYDGWARSMLSGARFYLYSLSPLPAFVVAAVYKGLGPDPLHVRLVNVVFGVATCWAMFAIGRALSGKAVGLLAALVAAIYKPFVFFSVTLLKEPLGLLLLSWILWLFLAELEEHRRVRVLLLGVATGLLVNVRQNAIVMLAVVVPLVLRHVFRSRRSPLPVVVSGAVLAAGFLTASAPFLAMNAQGTGNVSPIPLAGFDLYLGNYLPGRRPYYNPVPFSSTNPDEQGIQFTIEASRREGRRLTLGEGSAYWAREVAKSARRQTRAFACRLLQKALVVFNRFEEGDNHSIEFVSHFVPALKLPFLGFWLIMPLGMAGLITASRRDRRAAGLAALLVAYTVTLVIWFSNMRIRLPLVLILIPFAITGLRGLLGFEAWNGRARVGFALAVLLFGAIEVLPVAGTGDLTAHYNTHAIALSTVGRLEEAERYWRISSKLKGTWSPYADLALAALCLSRGETLAAQDWLERVPDDSFAASNKYDVMGDLLTAKSELPRAAAAYERSLSINSGQRLVRQKLLALYRVIDPEKISSQEERLAYVLSYYPASGQSFAPGTR